MAKPFYSIEEVCKKLNKDADGVKALVRDGSLREFRDGGKVFFKAEDVDKLAGGGKSDTGELMLESAEDELPSLAASSGGTSIIGLEPIEDEPKPGKKKGDTVISASGIKVFDEEELELDSDPMAKTQISPTATSDQVSLEGTGSGSGLLDLTREADDTSLGAELLDEIYPGEEEATAPVKKPAAKKEPEPEVEEVPADVGEVIAPVMIATSDPAEGIFAGVLVGGVLVMAVASTVVAGGLQGFVPSFTSSLAGGANTWIFLGSAVGAALLCAGVGWFVGKATSGPRRR